MEQVMPFSATGKYEVHNQPVEVLLAWLKGGEIAIPEIQRPFVWEAVKVRDLMDSLYQGYPIGYIIAWQSEHVKLKDGKTSRGKRILIDGQQRVTALAAAILGWPIVTSDYRKVRIRIAFQPIDERFEVSNTAIQRDTNWFADISEIMSSGIGTIATIREYLKKNPGCNESLLERNLDQLKRVLTKQIGIIELSHELDVETVTEIFIRINSKGVSLSQADFAMSKIASAEHYGGSEIRKAVDYFCHMAVEPSFVDAVKEVDPDFAKTTYFQQMSWLRKENDDLYDPSYSDLLRVSFTSQFKRGKLADLVSLLSGRNFETKTYEEAIVEQAFNKLDQGIRSFINETNFKRYIMILRSAGFIAPWLVRSQNVLNFGYAIFLILRASALEPALLEKFVRKWFVLSILTGRYSGAFESQIDLDVRQIESHGIEQYLRDTEKAELSTAFWEHALPQALETSIVSSPQFGVFLAAQAKKKDKGFLSRDITVEDLITQMGDIHHVFPKSYLKKQGLQKGRYNQIANYVYMQTEINIRIGDKPPNHYLSQVRKQAASGKVHLSGIDTEAELIENLRCHCIPESIFDMDIECYESFLDSRRKLMATKISDYYRIL